MNEIDFKTYLKESYQPDYSVRENWEAIVLNLVNDEVEAEKEYGMWFDEVVEDMGGGHYG